MVKYSCFLICLLLLPGFLRAEVFLFRAYTVGHMDIGPRIVEGQLVGFWKNDSSEVEGEIDLTEEFAAYEVRALGVFDPKTTPPPSRPAGSQWDFLGVAEGEPIYILPASGIPDTLPYLGFATEHPSVGHFDEFRIILEAVAGPPGATVSVYTSDTNIVMSSANGPPYGTLLIKTGNHLHYNWAFSRPGTYDLTFRFEALQERDVVLTGSDTFRFQITDGGTFDDYDHWRRTHFRPGDIENDEISGPDVDAGVAIGTTKGFTNAQRYAFGNDPFVELTTVEHNGQPWPAIRLPMRVGMQDLETGPEQSDSLTNGAWENTSFILEQTDFIFHDPGLEIRTYRIEEIPSGSSFFRAGAWVPEPAD